MGISEAIRGWLYQPILEKLKHMEAKMSEVSDLIQQLKDGIAKLSTDSQAAFARLEAKAASGVVTPADLADMRSVVGAIVSLDAAANAEAPDAPPVA